MPVPIARFQLLCRSLFLLAALLSLSVSPVAVATAIDATTLSNSKPGPTLCKKPIVRKEWRTLSKSTQLSYLKAVKCLLFSKPAITPKSVAPGVVGRYDDFVTTHILQTYSIHFVGQFLPWHRFYTATYEKALREECGYTGAQPYWDWTLDVSPLGNFTESPIFHPVYGFGGNGPFIEIPDDLKPYAVPGRTGGGCVTNGPFTSNTTVNMGPTTDLSGNPRCLSRDFSPSFAERYSGINTTKWTMEKEDFGTFVRAVEGGPSYDLSGIHGGGHFSVGGFLGEMGDMFNSPSDPVFFLHHTNLDRVWWSWQKKDLARRLTDISGPIYYMDYDNLQGGNVTLDFPLSIGVNAPNVTIGDTMDIRGGVLCYDYDKVYQF